MAKREKIKSIDLKIKILKDDLSGLKEIYKEGGGRKKEIEKIENEIELIEYEKNSFVPSYFNLYPDLKIYEIDKNTF